MQRSLSGLVKKRTQPSQDGETENDRASKRSRTDKETNDEVVQMSQTLTQNSNIRCGKVLSIQLFNFMCHSNLRMDFHSRINFLVGCNGSGKSAIIAGLVLGLGANARATSRSTSMKQFIKTGETAAKIEITISNEGTEAYEPQVYGRRITIVRNITQSAATYAIKAESGKVISKRSDTLQNILMYHNVQVDNPVFVLNQDTAREFLKDLEPAKNYKLFLKATQIDLIMEKNNDSLMKHKEHIIQLSVLRKKLSRDANELEQLEAKLLKLVSLVSLKDMIRQKELEHLWLLVRLEENEFLTFAEKAEALGKKRLTFYKAVNEKDAQEVEISEKIRKYDEDVVVKNAEFVKGNSFYNGLKTKFSQVRGRAQEIGSYLESYKKRQLYFQKQIDDLSEAIEERSQRNTDDVAKMRSNNEAKLKELRATQAENEAIVESAKRDLKIFIDNKMQKDEQIKNLNEKLRYDNNNIRHLEIQIGNINASSKDKLSIFGDHMLALKAEINKYYRAGKFTAMPRGPIGAYIEVPNEKFRNVVESQISSVLHAFIVTNAKDRFTLNEIINRTCVRFSPKIITTKFMNQVYNVSKGRVTPPRGTRVLMDEIKCSDPVVMNCLIDHARIETVLLAESHKVAEQVTANRENVPRNLSKVIVPDPGLEYFCDPFRMYSIVIKPARIIQVNVKERITQLKLEKQDLEETRKSLLSKISDLETQLSSDLKPIQDKRLLVERYDVQKYELREQIAELENFDYPDDNEMETLKNDLTNNESKLAAIHSQTQEKLKEHSETEAEKQRIEREMQEYKAKLDEIIETVNQTKATADAARMQLRNLSDNVERNQLKLTEVDKVIAECELAQSLITEKIKKLTTEACKKGERVETDSSPEELIDEIKTLKAKLKHREKITEDPDELRQLIAAKKEAIEIDKANYEKLKISVKMLKDALFKRFDYIKHLKQHMILCMQYTFQLILNMRQYCGEIQVNNKEQTLTLSVIPRDKNVANAVSSTRALSGGERSYTTIAFLISLWSCVDHPFYFLDEYDVFTDEVNRDYMTRLLISEGKRRVNRQYTFLTPLDMSLQASSVIKIHRLEEPERH